MPETSQVKLVAILITCHNRVTETLRCLECLANSIKPEQYEFHTYLVDDGSVDGTGDSVRFKFPEVIVIEGSGELFWCGGMRKAWSSALDAELNYDFFLWLNDDTFINEKALVLLFEDYRSLSRAALIVGAVRDPKTDRISYSGYSSSEEIVIPNGRMQKCHRINGNFVLVPREVCEKIGILSKRYTHGIGDADYSLRVTRGGFDCFVGSTIFGICEKNSKKDWFDPSLSFKERFSALFAVTGANIIEYLIFKKEHYGLFNCSGTLLKTIARLFFPKRFV